MLYLLTLSFPRKRHACVEQEMEREEFLTSPDFNSKFQAVTPIPSNINLGEKGGEVYKIYQVSAFKINQ